MKKFDVFFMLQGPVSTTEVPNENNPVECESLEEVLRQLSNNIPPMFAGVEIVGARIEEVG